jgi:hypothetical protein
MARGVFAGLVTECEKRFLDDWEPLLSAELYEAYLKCLNSLKKKDPSAAAEAATIYERLCRVDLAAALRVSD